MRRRRVEPIEVDAFDEAAPVEFGEPRQERMAPVQLVRPEGHDQDDPVVTELADQERDRLAGRRVGPVEVLDDEDDRLDLREPLEDPEDRVEHAWLECLGLGSRVRPAGAAERRHQAREIVAGAADDGVEDVRLERADERPQRFDDRAVWHAAVTDVGAAADDHAHPASRWRARTPRTTRRDLPTPASPATSWWIGVPARALSSARRIAASSVARPTSVGLTRRRGIPR